MPDLLHQLNAALADRYRVELPQDLAWIALHPANQSRARIETAMRALTCVERRSAGGEALATGARTGAKRRRLWWLGFLLAEAGKIAEAQEYAGEGMDRDPLTWTAHLARAAVHLFSGEFEAAVSAFRRILHRPNRT